MSHKVKTKIKFKTGNLLVSDFFRTPDGDIQSHVGEDRLRLNLNSAKGLLEEHKRYLKKKIIKVQVGNSCPSIYKKGNDLYFSGKNKDKSLKRVGSIITDLWAITIIEKEHLEEILESRGYSQKEIKNIIKSTTQQTIKVAPGTYECHSDVLNQSLKDTDDEILYFTLKKIKPPQNKKK